MAEAMTEQEMLHVEECVNRAVTQGIQRSIERIVRQHAEVTREAMIELSPLEKFIGKQVLVTTADRTWTGTLTCFYCGSWVQIEQYGLPIVIFTGAGLSVEFAGLGQRE